MFAEVITGEIDMHRDGKQLVSDNCMIRREIVRKVQYGTFFVFVFLIFWSIFVFFISRVTRIFLSMSFYIYMSKTVKRFS